jgi:predicted DCC family thiol-disulfide oxidoreductase YuxK
MKSAAQIAVSNYEFVDAGSETGQRLVAQRNLDVGSSAYVLDGERVLSRSDMMISVVRDMRLVGPLFAALIRLAPYSWHERAYDWLVRHRIR